MEFRKLGKPINSPSKDLDTFETPKGITLVRFTTDEVTSICPVTAQPDFSNVILEYQPDKLCIEGKSLKLYFWSFREEPIFAEGLASVIVKDIATAIQPIWVRVEVQQKVRGGLQLTAIAEHRTNDK